MKTLRIIAGGLFWFFVVLSSPVFSQSITIDLNTEYQSIRGFGGMSHTTWIRDLTADNREKAFGNDPGKIGLSILRIHLDPNPDLFSLELPTALHAVQKDAIVFASPWNAPGALLDPTTTPSRVDPEKYSDYVTHLNSFNTYLNNNGVPLYAISVQNEPDYGDWTRWTSGEMVDFMHNYAQDIENRVMAPESFQFRRDYTDPILNDSTANAHLDIVGGHIYGGGLFDYPLAREKGKDVWMTEHLTGSGSPGENTWSLALDLGTEINNCMKANFNAYVWWYIRRFYGLITDDGNISKKGFVMSQFTKFIRPGAVRIDGTVDSAPNVDVTAFKTDSSLVIVVINKNTTSISLDFTIQNGIIDTLTQFTTSATKNVVNDGGVLISAGTFNATVDGSSITTFTSYSANGGRYGNVPPIADAGSDIVIDDIDGSGSEYIVIDGSNSHDTDGSITNFNWSVDGEQWSLDTVFEYNSGIGEHVVVLTVTDNDGAIHSDTISVKINTLKNTNLWLEAECGQVGSTWEVPDDGNASNGQYVMTPAGTESLAEASADTADHIIFNFHASEAGSYKLWGRVITPTANDDSYWIKMDDDTTWAMWNSIPGGSTWHWAIVFDQSNGSQEMTYDLDTGYHTLSICYREDGAKLDKLLLTNTGSTPSETGDAATNCPDDDTVGIDELSAREVASIRVFPNPAHSGIQVTWEDEFQTLEIISVTGQFVIRKRFDTSIAETYLPVDLEPGVYILLLSNEYNSGLKKIIIE